MAAAGRDGRGGGLGDVDAAAGDDLDVGTVEMIPAAKVGEGDAEAVGDGYQSVAAASGVEDHAGGGGGRGRLGNDQGIEALKGTAGVELVCGGQF